MKVTLKVFRFTPERDTRPYYDTFYLETPGTERVLDLLEHIRGFRDSSLAFRRSCGHGMCGSDAMRINGRNRLACKMLVKDAGVDVIQIDPLLGLPVIRDLVVDMDPFYQHFNSVMPYFINDDPLPEDGRERLQSPEERSRFDETSKCILCAACTTACPPFWANQHYVGPAAIVNAHRFIYDSRDTAAQQRLTILSQPDGVWRCRTAFNCTEACPRDIPVTRAIAEVKQAMRRGALGD